MVAYWIARGKIADPAQYQKYAEKVPEILKKYSGKVLARGAKYQILEGPKKFERFVVVEFPSFERAVACHDSDEYQLAAALRKGGAGEVELVIVEGAP